MEEYTIKSKKLSPKYFNKAFYAPIAIISSSDQMNQFHCTKQLTKHCRHR